MRKILFIVIAFTTLISCSEYQKVLKKEDVGEKLRVAYKMYDEGNYTKAIRLFEQVAPSYRGKPQGERLFYMFANSYYKTKQYYLAAYQFESFTSSYPKSEKFEEALYLSAKSFSKLSPAYTLDQVDTHKALDKIQNFINAFPNSEYLDDANKIALILRQKLEKKAYENAKQYHTISDFKAAIVALDLYVNEFPGAIHAEDALFYRFDSAYLLAINSVESKMEERLKTAIETYNKLLKFNPNTKYKQKADQMLRRVESDLNNFAK